MKPESTIAVLPQIECCGCGACYNICPKQAIAMEYDPEGFLYPRIHEEQCISCGKCRSACPSISGQYHNSANPDCYVAMAEDEVRKDSSSGGIFPLLAEYVLRQGGAVCGAAYDSEFKVEHIIVNRTQDLEKLKKSKYVQSDTGKVYTEIQEILKEGRAVLFCGCPCQVAGLKTFLGQDYEQLYTIDLMCHGAPSPGLFEKYLKEIHGSKKITHVGFRDKEYYGWSTEMTVKYSDGTVYHNTRSIDPFYKAFLPLLSTRPHCGQCRFSAVPRQGDVTLADFWGVEKYDPKYSDGKGTSLMTINSSKGQAILEAIRGKMPVCDKMPRDYIYKTGQPFDHCFKSHPARDRFMNLVQFQPIEKAYEYAVKRKFDVAIMGVWSGCNYGSIMTYYALYRLVESFGSDQVWNYGISRNFGRSYFFDFVDDDKKKIAYAASFGHDGFFASKQEKQTTAHLLERFDAISVRESRGVSICNDTFHVRATQVLDPVFAADPGIFDEISDRSSADEKEEYVVSYILDPTPEKREALQYTAAHFHCKFVITDSCHGASFAILFQKPFICIANEHRGLSRFESLLSLFQLKDRYVTDAGEIVKPGNEKLLSNIDYEAVYRIMDRERARSRAWLKDALFAPKVIHNWRAYPIVDEQMDASYKRRIRDLESQKEAARKNVHGVGGSLKQTVRELFGKA